MSKPVVLAVDDVEMNLLILKEILKDDYDIVCASSGLQAIDMIFNFEVIPKIILLDIMMPDMDGYEVLEILKSNTAFKSIPVVFITASDTEETALAAGAVDYISKPFQSEIVKLRVVNHLKLKNYSDSLEEMVQQKVNEITSTRDKMLEAMANIIEYRNLESGSHVKRTILFSTLLINHLLRSSVHAEQLEGLDPNIITKSVSLHDVGKIGIPDAILLKPGKLTVEEFEIMKTHTTIGKNIIESILADGDELYLKHCRDIAYCHHERYDGKGYPNGLKGEEIPLPARILSLVDVYDALRSKRCYKPAFSHEEALDLIKEGDGTQFDPVIVKALFEVGDKFDEISITETD